MKYQITISGMHCSGCKNLITMSLEDAGLTDVFVDPDKSLALFKSVLSKEEIENLLKSVFTELKEYSYSNFQIIN
jgi:copper chaperone CopZ